MFVLSETRSQAWVEGLCPKDLWHYYAMHLELRTERLREDLHVLVSASIAATDGGKAFQAMDERLAPKGKPKHGDQKPRDSGEIPVGMTAAQAKQMEGTAQATAPIVEAMLGARRVGKRT